MTMCGEELQWAMWRPEPVRSGGFSPSPIREAPTSETGREGRARRQQGQAPPESRGPSLQEPLAGARRRTRLLWRTADHRRWKRRHDLRGAGTNARLRARRGGRRVVDRGPERPRIGLAKCQRSPCGRGWCGRERSRGWRRSEPIGLPRNPRTRSRAPGEPRVPPPRRCSTSGPKRPGVGGAARARLRSEAPRP